MGLPELVAAIMLAALVLYALLGGADFGGGLWDLLARGPRAAAQRSAIERALAPVWEANHVWLILVVVLLFTGFPPAFARLSIALHVPLTIALVGIVLRGSAFVFRQYGGGDDGARRRWGQVFAVASTITPVFLGVILGAITAGAGPTTGGPPPSATALGAGVSPFTVAVGLFALACFAFLAAVYLTCEADDAALADDFRRRALGAAAAVAALAVVCAALAGPGASRFAGRLVGSWWSWPLAVVTLAAALGAVAALLARRFHLARLAAIAQVALLVIGWGLAQHPVLIAPDLTIRAAAAPDRTFELLAPVLAVGSLVLFPALYWMLRVFKRRPPTAAG
jgi:cytochrome bd ubiquinol oxidase subunit II